MASIRQNELIRRLLAVLRDLHSPDEAGSPHVCKLADLNRPGHREKSEWIRLMAMRRRKTPVVCRHCHENIHRGRPPPART
ncbi:hypothetical protein [Streptomyces sp. AC555_RSS877]|uniref:HNH endonuclease n=1 Tax=Streptomyces sp. AC555_RSS877 TaxID=2823688 RepID=UPI0035ABD0CE